MDEEIQFDIEFDSGGGANIVGLNPYTRELFSCLIEEEVVGILKPYLNYAITGYIKMRMKNRIMDYLQTGNYYISEIPKSGPWTGEPNNG